MSEANDVEIADCNLPSHPPGVRGPRTEEGKRWSRRNATSHGIFAQIAFAGEHGESFAEYKRLHKELRKAISPVRALEETLVAQLAYEFHRLGRVYKAERGIAPLIFERVARAVDDKDVQQPIEIDRRAEIIIPRKDLDPEIILRYTITINKQIGRILSQLERLQRMRLGQPLTPPINVQVTE